MLELNGFAIVLLYGIGGASFLILTLLVSKIIRPANKRSDGQFMEKMTTYESGEQPVGSAWGAFNIRFYVVALIFILFEAELIFLFPWATIFGDSTLLQASENLWSIISFAEISIFLLMLIVGLIYVWAKKMLDWQKPIKRNISHSSSVPYKLYDEVNARY